MPSDTDDADDLKIPLRYDWLLFAFFACCHAMLYVVVIYIAVSEIFQSHGDPATVALYVSSSLLLGGMYGCTLLSERPGVAPKRQQVFKLVELFLSVAYFSLWMCQATSEIGLTIMSAVSWGMIAALGAVGCYRLRKLLKLKS